MTTITRDEILSKMEIKCSQVQAALREAIEADTENEAIGSLAPVAGDLADLKALADALVALRR